MNEMGHVTCVHASFLLVEREFLISTTDLVAISVHHWTKA